MGYPTHVDKPYAFIQIAGENIDGVERLTFRILQDSGDPTQFVFKEHLGLPGHLADSFSRGFEESAMRLGRSVVVTEATRDLRG